MKCSFCATGKGGFARNLRIGEILAQVPRGEKDEGESRILVEEISNSCDRAGQITAIEREFGESATHVVFMGKRVKYCWQGFCEARYVKRVSVGLL